MRPGNGMRARCFLPERRGGYSFMGSYIVRRLGVMLWMLLGITVISFAVIRMAPGKPVILQYTLNPRISPETLRRLQEQEGLDKPLHIQYWHWLSNISRLNFGRSLSDNRPVMEKIAERAPLTVGLNVVSLLIVLALAIPLGVRCAVKAESAFDHTVTVVLFLLFAAPTFWLALLLMQFFCIHLRWLPISGAQSLDFEYMSWPQKFVDIIRHFALPVLVSSLGGITGISRYMRQSMRESLQQPYIITARAKGLSERVVLYKHALRNAVLPIITILGLSVPGLLGGSVIFESIFALPGMGRLFYEAAMMRDINLIMAEVVLVGVLTMAGNLMADIAYAWADPRIRYQKV
jgi:peptide/nickel transport system permease protein